MESLGEVAGAFLRQEISKGLDSGFPYNLRFVGDPTNTGGRFQTTPHNLLGTLFLQLGQAIAGNREQRPCKACGNWFELVPHDKGRKEFCSDGCKAKDYRERKKRAIELRVAGNTPKQIAEVIQTDIESVKRWVASVKRKGN
jgi:hypothetical protein